MNNSQICPGKCLLQEYSQAQLDLPDSQKQGSSNQQKVYLQDSRRPIQTKVSGSYYNDYKTIVEKSLLKMPHHKCCAEQCSLVNSPSLIKSFQQNNQKPYEAGDLHTSSLQLQPYNNQIKSEQALAQQKQAQPQIIIQQQEDHDSQQLDSEELSQKVLEALEQFKQNVIDGRYTYQKLKEVLEHIQ